MKTWAQFEPEAKAGLLADPLNEELRAHSATVASIDRTQLPSACVTRARLAANALHFLATETIGVQTDQVHGSTVAGDWWRGSTFQEHTSSWQTHWTATYQSSGGTVQVEWAGSGAVNQTIATSVHNLSPGNPKSLFLRILINGQVAGTFQGIQAIESFRVFGCAFTTAGPVRVDLQWTHTGSGPDDPQKDHVTSYQIGQAHLISSRVLVIGRIR